MVSQAGKEVGEPCRAPQAEQNDGCDYEGDADQGHGKIVAVQGLLSQLSRAHKGTQICFEGGDEPAI